MLLRTGRRGVSAIQMAMDLLRENGGLAGLLTATPHSLRRTGLGPAKAAALLAAVEIGRRLAREQLLDREPLSRPVDVARYLALRYHTCDQEVMGALFLDARSRLLGEREMFRGTLSRISVEPREILASACSGAPPRSTSSTPTRAAIPRRAPRTSSSPGAWRRRRRSSACASRTTWCSGSRGRWVSLRGKGRVVA